MATISSTSTNINAQILAGIERLQDKLVYVVPNQFLSAKAYPVIGSFWEAPAEITGVAGDKFALCFKLDNEFARAVAPYYGYPNTSVVLPIEAYTYLVEESVHKQTLSRVEPFSVGDVVYLAPFAPGETSPENPKVGTRYTVHGKIWRVFSNKNETQHVYLVNWFNPSGLKQKVGNVYEHRYLLTADEYVKLSQKNVLKYKLRTPDALTRQDIEFILSDKYFISEGNTLLISEKFKNLFQKV